MLSDFVIRVKVYGGVNYVNKVYVSLTHSTGVIFANFAVEFFTFW